MDVNERASERASDGGKEREEENNSNIAQKNTRKKMYQLIKLIQNDSPSPPTLAAISSHAQSVKYLFLKNGVALL